MCESQIGVARDSDKPRPSDFARATTEAAPRRPATLPRGGTETILVVEDEPQVRGVLRTILRRAGYRVLEASGGIDALRVAGATDEPIHLMLTDVVMPRMSGHELAEALTGERPDTRVLFMSGYAPDAVVGHAVVEAGINYIPKPMTPEALLRRVRSVLDATA